MSAPSTSGLSVKLHLRVIDVKYGCFSLLLLIYMIKAVGAVSMQGHRQPRSHACANNCKIAYSCQLKARANARNIVGPNMLRAFAHHVVCCCVLLRLVGSCWMKFETGQTSEPTSANISIVSRSSKRGPTMLLSFAQHIQQCCAGARALHATYPHKYMLTRNQHGVGDGKRPRVPCILI